MSYYLIACISCCRAANILNSILTYHVGPFGILTVSVLVKCAHSLLLNELDRVLIRFIFISFAFIVSFVDPFWELCAEMSPSVISLNARICWKRSCHSVELVGKWENISIQFADQAILTTATFFPATFWLNCFDYNQYMHDAWHYINNNE